MATSQFPASGKVVETAATKKLTGSRIPGVVKQPAANPLNDTAQAPYKVATNTVTGYVGTDPIYKNYADPRYQPLPNTPLVVTGGDPDAEGRLTVSDAGLVGAEDKPEFEGDSGVDLNEVYEAKNRERDAQFGAVVPNAKTIHDDGTVTDLYGNPAELNVPDSGDVAGGGTKTANRERAEDPKDPSDGREEVVDEADDQTKKDGDGADETESEKSADDKDEEKSSKPPTKAAAKKVAPPPAPKS